jgi:transcriptional regulator with XRE-family HTH domain
MLESLKNLKTIRYVHVGSPKSIEYNLLQILRRTKGMTQEELAKALGTTTHTVRSLISIDRQKGFRIVDSLIPSETGKKFYKKEYKLAKNSEEYYEWCIRQLGENVPPRLGNPRV